MIEVLVSDFSPADVVDLAVIKLQCRIEQDETDEDVLLGLYRDAAAHACGTEIGCPLLPTEWLRKYGPGEPIVLPREVLCITAVSIQVGGATVVVDPSACSVFPDNKLVCAGGWPTDYEVIQVSYLSGRFKDKDAIPGAIKQWVILRAATAYAHREAVFEGPLSALPRTFVDGLLDAYRVY